MGDQDHVNDPAGDKLTVFNHNGNFRAEIVE
jgi:hypothetical protein